MHKTNRHSYLVHVCDNAVRLSLLFFVIFTIYCFFLYFLCISVNVVYGRISDVYENYSIFVTSLIPKFSSFR